MIPPPKSPSLGIDPTRSGIPENALTNPSPVPVIRHGKQGRDAQARLGQPPPSPVTRPHTYAFQLFALDQAVGLPDSFTLKDTLAAIKGHVIGRARLDGTCEIRSHPHPSPAGTGECSAVSLVLQNVRSAYERPA